MDTSSIVAWYYFTSASTCQKYVTKLKIKFFLSEKILHKWVYIQNLKTIKSIHFSLHWITCTKKKIADACGRRFPRSPSWEKRGSWLIYCTGPNLYTCRWCMTHNNRHKTASTHSWTVLQYRAFFARTHNDWTPIIIRNVCSAHFPNARGNYFK